MGTVFPKTTLLLSHSVPRVVGAIIMVFCSVSRIGSESNSVKAKAWSPKIPSGTSPFVDENLIVTDWMSVVTLLHQRHHTGGRMSSIREPLAQQYSPFSFPISKKPSLYTTYSTLIST